jgi:predicted metal-binding protein
MAKKVKIGIIICDRYHTCAGGKCFRSLREREGAFGIYSKDDEVEVVGFTTCGGCPGGNIEYAPEEMKKNGAEVIHLATGMLVGYPPCHRIDYFRKFIPERFGLKVVSALIPYRRNIILYIRNLKHGTPSFGKNLLSRLSRTRRPG